MVYETVYCSFRSIATQTPIPPACAETGPNYTVSCNAAGDTDVGSEPTRVVNTKSGRLHVDCFPVRSTQMLFYNSRRNAISWVVLADQQSPSVFLKARGTSSIFECYVFDIITLYILITEYIIITTYGTYAIILVSRDFIPPAIDIIPNIHTIAHIIKLTVGLTTLNMIRIVPPIRIVYFIKVSLLGIITALYLDDSARP